MPRGPLPDPNHRHRNAPAIPTTNLPASGFKGPIPRPPKWVPLGRAGTAWWRWAWRTPAAAAWSTNDHPMIARRASLEDDLAALAAVEGLDADEAAATDKAAELKLLVQRLASLVTGRLSIVKEMRELEKGLGLYPKAMADLRWKVADDSPAPQTTTSSVPSLEDRRSRLSNAS